MTSRVRYFKPHVLNAAAVAPAGATAMPALMPAGIAAAAGSAAAVIAAAATVSLSKRNIYLI